MIKVTSNTTSTGVSGSATSFISIPAKCDIRKFCQNGGTCQLATDTTYKCLCLPHFYGDHCEQADGIENIDQCILMKHKQALNYLESKSIVESICHCSDGRMPDATRVCAYEHSITLSLHSQQLCQFDIVWDAAFRETDSSKYKMMADIIVAGLYQVADANKLIWAEAICIEKRPFRVGFLNSDFVVKNNGLISNTNASQAFSDAVDHSGGQLGNIVPSGGAVQDINECEDDMLNECANGMS